MSDRILGRPMITERRPLRLYVYNGDQPFTGPVKTRPTAEQLAADLAAGHESWHGTLGGTTNHRCKCTPCRDVWAAHSRTYRASKKDEQ